MKCCKKYRFSVNLEIPLYDYRTKSHIFNYCPECGTNLKVDKTSQDKIFQQLLKYNSKMLNRLLENWEG